ncbi:MAG: anti-sigma factor [Chloroflexota bacterium]
MTDHEATVDARTTPVGGLTCAEADEMAALGVLDMLTAAEAAQVQAHLDACEQPHADVQRAAEAAGALASSVDPVVPPTDLRARLMAAIASTPQVPDRLMGDDVASAPPAVGAHTRSAPPVTPFPAAAPVPETANVVPFEQPGRPTRPARVAWIGLAAAAVIALLLGGWGLSLQQQLTTNDQQLALVRQAIAAAADPTSRVATLTGTDAGAGVSGMAIVPASGTGYIMLQGLPALSGGQVYQAWYLAEGVPTSAGLMPPASSGVAVMAGLDPVAGTDTIALTVEPAGGVEAPTGAVVAAGTLPA